MNAEEFEKRQHMKKMYKNAKELFISKKFDSFVKEAKKYLEVVPDDIAMRFMRAKSLRYLKRFDEAIEELKYILNIECNLYALTKLYYTYYHLNMYSEAIELLPKVYETRCIKTHSVCISELIMKKQLGIPMKIRPELKCDYLLSQVDNYSDSNALEHISEHLTENESGNSIFNKDINLEYLFELIKSNIKNENKANVDEILEIHYFGISNIGYSDGNACSFIRVVVIPNTNNIITMYPINDFNCNSFVEHITPIDCDYNKLFNRPKVDIKRESRVDRFNRRMKKV